MLNLKSRVQNTYTEKPYNVEKQTKVLHKKKRLYKIIPVFKVGRGTMDFLFFPLITGYIPNCI